MSIKKKIIALLAGTILALGGTVGSYAYFTAQDTLSGNTIRTQEYPLKVSIDMYASVGPVIYEGMTEINNEKASKDYYNWMSNASKKIASKIDGSIDSWNQWEDNDDNKIVGAKDFINIPYKNSNGIENIKSVSIKNTIGHGSINNWQGEANHSKLNEPGTMTHFLIAIKGVNGNKISTDPNELENKVNINVEDIMEVTKEDNSKEEIVTTTEWLNGSYSPKYHRVRFFNKNDKGQYIEVPYSHNEKVDLVVYDIGSPVYYLRNGSEEDLQVLANSLSGNIPLSRESFSKEAQFPYEMEELLSKYGQGNNTVRLKEKRVTVDIMTKDEKKLLESIGYKIRVAPIKDIK